MIRRFAAGVALASGLALSLTGCLGDAGDKVGQAGDNLKLTAAQVLGKTAEKTGQVDSFQADLSMRMTGSSEGTVSMTGGMEYRTKPDLAYRMSFDKMTVAGQSLSGIEMILVDRTMYMKMPMLSQLGGSSAKPWMKISLDELGAKSGMNIDQLLEQSRQMDPVQNTRMLTASKDAREVGKETLNGVQTTHYTGTYRLEDAIAKLPADQRSAYRKTLGQSGMGGDMHFDLWVDDQQMPRQLTMKSRPGSGQSMTLTMKYRDFGKPVQVTAPPAGQVSDFGAMMKQLQGAGGMPRT